MKSLIRSHFGIPGVIAVMALVFAMFGGAYAATNGNPLAGASKHKRHHKKGKKHKKKQGGLTGKQKKEVEKIAKKFQGTGPKGDKGDAGAAGATGATGDAGAAGATGATGATGEPGEDGETGPEGSPWTDGGTLPEGSTETGSWAAEFTGESMVQFSFNIPLKDPIPASNVAANAKGYDGHGELTPEEEHCPGDVSDPRAAPGYFCAYTATGVLGNGAIASIAPADQTTFGAAEGTSTAGGWLFMFSTNASHTVGTWAVTAPTA